MEIIDRRDWVKYLVIPYWHTKVISENIIEADPGREFNEFIEKQMISYINEKREPPAEIASAIMNLADDYLAGREMTIKAGDYLSIQKYIRGGKF